MEKITNLEWILPDDLDIARNIVKELADFTQSDQFVAWHQLRHTIPHRGANAFFDDFETLKKHPGKLRDAICKFSIEYNQLLESFRQTHPASCAFIWDIYCESGAVIRGTSAIPSKLREFTDREFAFWYASLYGGLKESLRQNPNFKQFDISSVKLINHEKEYMHGIGRYHFQDSEGNKMTTLWDIREEEIPKFMYG